MNLKAITILELMIALFIASIMISFGYFGYLFIVRQVSTVEKEDEKSIELDKCITYMQWDITRSDEWVANDNGFEIIMDESTVTYTWQNQILLREGDRMDTLEVEISNSVAEFLPGPIKLLSALKLEVIVGDSTREILFSKEYPAEKRLNRDRIIWE